MTMFLSSSRGSETVEAAGASTITRSGSPLGFFSRQATPHALQLRVTQHASTRLPLRGWQAYSVEVPEGPLRHMGVVVAPHCSHILMGCPKGSRFCGRR